MALPRSGFGLVRTVAVGQKRYPTKVGHPGDLTKMKKKILITWPLPEAVMARARASYDVIAHGDDPKITIDEMLEKAKSVDAILLTLNEKCRKDVIDRMPENIKCISTFSIGFDHIDLEACQGPRHQGRQRAARRHGRNRRDRHAAALGLRAPRRRRRAHDSRAGLARLAAAAARRPASRWQGSRHLRLRKNRPGAGTARPRLRHAHSLLRPLPPAG